MSDERRPSELIRLACAYNRAFPAFTVLAAIAIGIRLLNGWHPTERFQEVVVGLFVLALYLIAWIANLFTIAELAMSLGMNRWLAIPSGILLFLPHVGVPYGTALLIWAFFRLRTSGVKAWPFRVPSAEVDRIASRQCRHCGYPRTGLASGAPCPECGTAAPNPAPAVSIIPTR